MIDKIKEIEVMLRLDHKDGMRVRDYCFWNNRCPNKLGKVAVYRSNEVAFPCSEHFKGYLVGGWKVLK